MFCERASDFYQRAKRIPYDDDDDDEGKGMDDGCHSSEKFGFIVQDACISSN